MSSSSTNTREARARLENTTLYEEFKAERDEILRHKWIESQKAGRDIGFEAALLDWNSKHRLAWRRSRQRQAHAHPQNVAQEAA